MTFDEYMAFEEASLVRHEFVDGEAYAMSGVTRRHSVIALNIALCLRAGARGGHCRVYATEVKVRATKTVVYYPDVAVECGVHDLGDEIVDDPCLVVEVASRTTRRIDRGEKLANYKNMPSVRAYLMVEQTRRQVTFWSRGVDGEWTAIELIGSGVMSLPCPAMELTLDQIYEDVEIPMFGVVSEPEVDEMTGEYVVG